jgi:hypothetical protein
MLKSEGWDQQDTIEVPEFDDRTTKVRHILRETSMSRLTPSSTQVALSVISACGFSEPLPWEGSLRPSMDTEPTVQNTIRPVADSLLVRLMIPNWAWLLPIERFVTSNTNNPLSHSRYFSLRRIDWSYRGFEKAMLQKVNERKAELRGDKSPSSLVTYEEEARLNKRKDVFTRLILASEQEAASSLSDRELLGNAFIFIFAGHGT